MIPAAHTHQTVLLEEAVSALVTAPGGVYVDGTFGRGGHSRLILDRLNSEGRLLVIDKDPEAIKEAELLAASDPRVRVQRGSFANIGAHIDAAGWSCIDGVLLDLGVSSPQLDDPERGFSFMRDGPLDMRMDPDAGLSASQWLAVTPEQEIARVIWEYGEEKFSRRIARRLVEARVEGAISTTGELANLISEAVPRKEKHKHPATRSFQAIRIHLNRELEDLDEALTACAERLALKGRLVVISFHSLEDRRVKRFMRSRSQPPVLPKGLPVRAVDFEPDFRLVGKAVKASGPELAVNVRSRSAIMRTLERVSAAKE
ncbi:16S rRNA (cytosine(1402)-N(4))-methyltransferase RsmH [Hydrocarboniclastica marina]|uniref:Ribosomal RNA small subunit methyltransferase H n=1 Tax=Hydrocarboniclastica marina TaxID=2259620 RepID=A0A4V1D8G7_9ALTE|nr:16S rRNA (cytosine(1402)-N(4))-methyltransferase RsmH [Hydrocarboniclastica marina]QCF25130.1 16S rRNA (cytosine(1402)-N(4))-methyltransferase RsmH [Hydrocarboniclastica marina]